MVTDFAAAKEALKEDICMDNVDGNRNTMKARSQKKSVPVTSLHRGPGPDQVIVTSPGDTAFDKMSSEMEGLLKSNANLQSAGIREARKLLAKTCQCSQADRLFAGRLGGVQCAACLALCILYGQR